MTGLFQPTTPVGAFRPTHALEVPYFQGKAVRRAPSPLPGLHRVELADVPSQASRSRGIYYYADSTFEPAPRTLTAFNKADAVVRLGVPESALAREWSTDDPEETAATVKWLRSPDATGDRGAYLDQFDGLVAILARARGYDWVSLTHQPNDVAAFGNQAHEVIDVRGVDAARLPAALESFSRRWGTDLRGLGSPTTTTGSMPDFSTIRQSLEPRVMRRADWLPSDSFAEKPTTLLTTDELLDLAQRSIPPPRRAAAMAVAMRRVRVHIPAILEAVGYNSKAAEEWTRFFSSAEHSLITGGPRITGHQAITGPIITLSYTVKNAVIHWPVTVHLRMLLRLTNPSMRLRWIGLQAVVMTHAIILTAWRLGLLETTPREQGPFRDQIPRAIAEEVRRWWTSAAVHRR